jgi:hypothetical protein
MAKQTFTTGQVLTAAQMTSLQQTAMLGGAASAKTASYTLVAADAGTAISMSSASATTITVNTALFAAGDTVQITNLGVGVCTITAGTATVNTSASLALAQYESGTLDFTSTSAAIFIKGAGASAASGAYTQAATGSLTGSSITISSLSGSSYWILYDAVSLSAAEALMIRLNGDTGSNYSRIGTATATSMETVYLPTAASSFNIAIFVDLANTAAQLKPIFVSGFDQTAVAGGVYKSTSAITSITLFPSGGTFDGGNYYIWSKS